MAVVSQYRVQRDTICVILRPTSVLLQEQDTLFSM